MDTDPNKMLTAEQVAELLGLRPCTIAAWREDGSQPDLPFFKMGRAVRYRYADVVAFIERRRAVNTVVARAIVDANAAKVGQSRGSPAKAPNTAQVRKPAPEAVSTTEQTNQRNTSKADPHSQGGRRRRSGPSGSDDQQSLF